LADLVSLAGAVLELDDLEIDPLLDPHVFRIDDSARVIDEAELAKWRNPSPAPASVDEDLLALPSPRLERPSTLPAPVRPLLSP
jgi:hypothetical protein